ncbi:MAG: SpoIIIAH-like family protein [Ruminococcaceae bacterium]|nr:SpoIIIAH-like family protein [Oscillospiraceae bacterium]
MKIIKTEKPESTEVSEYKTWNKIKTVLTKNVKRNIAIVSTLVLIAGAVYLNWILFADGDDYKPGDYVSGGETANKGENQGDGTTAGNENADSYFALAVIDRSEARAEALEVLSKITTSEEANDEAKQNAYAEMAKIAEEIECESNIETLIKAKGFEECVVVIGNGKANIIVSGENLLASEVAQIREIVYTQANISPENITIIEKAV